MLDLVHRKRIGFIPTAWNPTDVDITRNGKRLAITSANAAGRCPRRCAGPYAVGDCSTGDYAYAVGGRTRPSTKGGISVVRDAAEAQDAAQAHARRCCATTACGARIAAQADGGSARSATSST